MQLLSERDIEDEQRAIEAGMDPDSDDLDRDSRRRYDDRDRRDLRDRGEDDDRYSSRRRSGSSRRSRLRARPHELRACIDGRTASRLLALLDDTDLAAPLRADKLEECLRLCGAVIEDAAVQAVLEAAQNKGGQASRALESRGMRHRLVVSSGRHGDGSLHAGSRRRSSSSRR